LRKVRGGPDREGKIFPMEFKHVSTAGQRRKKLSEDRGEESAKPMCRCRERGKLRETSFEEKSLNIGIHQKLIAKREEEGYSHDADG